MVGRIGQGGMGSVYKVRDRELDRIIALKTIRPDLAANSGAIRRFKQEILLARQITHRNVIRIHDFGVADGLRFITMEWFDGEDFGLRLSRVRKLMPPTPCPSFASSAKGSLPRMPKTSSIAI